MGRGSATWAKGMRPLYQRLDPGEGNRESQGPRARTGARSRRAPMLRYRARPAARPCTPQRAGTEEYCRRLGLHTVRTGLAQDRVDALDQLAGTERLGDVVVRADLEADLLIDVASLG